MVAMSWVCTAWRYALDCSSAASAPFFVLRIFPKASISHWNEGATLKDGPCARDAPSSAESDAEGKNASLDACSVASASSTRSLARLRSVLCSSPIRMYPRSRLSAKSSSHDRKASEVVSLLTASTGMCV